jgi:integrase
MKAIEPVIKGKMNPPRQEVPTEDVIAVFPYVTETVADMLRLQLLTGMRPKELYGMHVSDIKRTKEEISKYYLFDDNDIKDIWIYVLSEHKTKKYIGTKIIPLGKEEQNILTKYLDRPLDSFVFWNKHGKPMNRDCYDRNVKDAIDKHKLNKFIPYRPADFPGRKLL